MNSAIDDFVGSSVEYAVNSAIRDVLNPTVRNVLNLTMRDATIGISSTMNSILVSISVSMRSAIEKELS